MLVPPWIITVPLLILTVSLCPAISILAPTPVAVTVSFTPVTVREPLPMTVERELFPISERPAPASTWTLLPSTTAVLPKPVTLSEIDAPLMLTVSPPISRTRLEAPEMDAVLDTPKLTLPFIMLTLF